MEDRANGSHKRAVWRCRSPRHSRCPEKGNGNAPERGAVEHGAPERGAVEHGQAEPTGAEAQQAGRPCGSLATVGPTNGSPRPTRVLAQGPPAAVSLGSVSLFTSIGMSVTFAPAAPAPSSTSMPLGSASLRLAPASSPVGPASVPLGPMRVPLEAARVPLEAGSVRLVPALGRSAVSLASASVASALSLVSGLALVAVSIMAHSRSSRPR